MPGNIIDACKLDDLVDFINDVSEAILKDSCSLFVGAGSSRQYGFDDWNALVIRTPHGNNELNDVTQKAGYAFLKDGRFKTTIQKNIEETVIDINNMHPLRIHHIRRTYKNFPSTKSTYQTLFFTKQKHLYKNV